MTSQKRQSTHHEDESIFVETPTFSLQIVLMTSSGGVPSSSVMIENWFTSAVGMSSNVS